MTDQNARLLDITALAKRYCDICENSLEYTKEEFIDHSLDLLPRLYWNFFDLTAGVSLGDSDFFTGYVDEAMYEDVRRKIASLMGASDTFLDTFEEDMKYSETPIASTISECMADIFQPLYNFVAVVHDSEGTQLEEAYINCKEDFENYWSQTLCNVLKALNNIKYDRTQNEDYD